MKFRKGRKAVVVKEDWHHGFDKGEEVFFTGDLSRIIVTKAYRFVNTNGIKQLLMEDDFEWVEEE
ncbi:hypothetical protein [Bacillus phage vB_BanS-Thrax1]|nr:hypothetical protein [Bacillus phage vB_BanS-Thrax1]